MTERPVELKIAYIGGGSRQWARIIMADLACCPDLGGEMRLYDLNYEAAKLNEQLGNWVHQRPEARSSWRYRAVEQLGEALTGADVVFISVQPGPLDMMAHELEVSERYGRYFPVGDTTGAPGLMRGLRSATMFAGFAEAIAEHCPDAWVINYTNPMSVCTRTLTRVAPRLKAFGCCHEVFGTQHTLAKLAQDALELEQTPERDEIRVNVLGVNHFTWLDSATYQGHDLLAMLREHIRRPGILRPHTHEELEARNNWFQDNNQIKFTLFERFGALAAAGDRHLCEFVPGFVDSEETLHRWGVIRTPVSWRRANQQRMANVAREIMDGTIPFRLRESHEEAVRQLKALVGLGDFVTNVNFRNVGQMPGMPKDVVVETNARFSRDRVEPIVAGELPPGVQAQVARHVANQELIVEAALTRDRELAFQAVFNDPTTNLPLDRAWALFEEIGLPQGW
jgi:galacturan 1,4-alpha-galacturonidase